MAEERQEGQELLLPPHFVGRVLGILPTPNFALQSWEFVAQDGACRPGVEMCVLMEPPSGGSIEITLAFLGTGSPRKATFISAASSVEAKMNFWGDDPWKFIEYLWRLHTSIRW